MTRGPKPKPTALRRLDGNPGKRGYNRHEPMAPDGVPICPDHLSLVAREEWDRLAYVLFNMGVVTLVDRAVFAAYCQCYARWVEAEQRLQASPLLLKTPSGYVQQSPWLSVVNKQLDLMGRYMAELGITPASRSRIVALSDLATAPEPVTKIEFVIVDVEKDGRRTEWPMDGSRTRSLRELASHGSVTQAISKADS